MNKPSFVLLLAGMFMLLIAIYVYYLLDYQSPFVLILVGLIGLLYLMLHADSKK